MTQNLIGENLTTETMYISYIASNILYNYFYRLFRKDVVDIAQG